MKENQIQDGPLDEAYVADQARRAIASGGRFIADWADNFGLWGPTAATDRFEPEVVSVCRAALFRAGIDVPQNVESSLQTNLRKYEQTVREAASSIPAIEFVIRMALFDDRGSNYVADKLDIFRDHVSAPSIAYSPTPSLARFVSLQQICWKRFPSLGGPDSDIVDELLQRQSDEGGFRGLRRGSPTFFASAMAIEALDRSASGGSNASRAGSAEAVKKGLWFMFHELRADRTVFSGGRDPAKLSLAIRSMSISREEDHRVLRLEAAEELLGMQDGSGSWSRTDGPPSLELTGRSVCALAVLVGTHEGTKRSCLDVPEVKQALALSEVHAEAAGSAVEFDSRVPEIRIIIEDPDYQVGDEGQSPRNGVFDIKVRHYLSELSRSALRGRLVLLASVLVLCLGVAAILIDLTDAIGPALTVGLGVGTMLVVIAVWTLEIRHMREVQDSLVHAFDEAERGREIRAQQLCEEFWRVTEDWAAGPKRHVVHALAVSMGSLTLDNLSGFAQKAAKDGMAPPSGRPAYMSWVSDLKKEPLFVRTRVRMILLEQLDVKAPRS